MTDSFYVVNVVNTNVVLGVQWLYSIGKLKYTTDYRTMEMELQGPDGKRVVLRGMNTFPQNQYPHREWRSCSDRVT